jgi:hypothetical protein
MVKISRGGNIKKRGISTNLLTGMNHTVTASADMAMVCDFIHSSLQNGENKLLIEIVKKSQDIL